MDDQRRGGRRIEAAVDAVLASETLLSGGHVGLVEDALALLHRYVLDAGSLDELRWLLDKPRLRARLAALKVEHADRPFMHRASSELALAFELGFPPAPRPLPRLQRWLEPLGRTLASVHVAAAAVVVADLALAWGVAVSTLLWALGLRNFPAPIDRWIVDGVLGHRPVADLLAFTSATLVVAGAFSLRLAEALDQRQRARDARRTVAHHRRYALARKTAAVALSAAALALVGGLAASVWSVPTEEVLATTVKEVAVAAFCFLPVFLGSMVVLAAASSLVTLAQAVARVAARALPRAPESDAPTWAAGAFASSLAQWRCDREVARRVAANAAVRDRQERESARVADLATRLQAEMTGAPAARDPGAPVATTLYRVAPPTDATAAVDSAPNPIHEAWRQLLEDPSRGDAFRADFIVAFARRAGETPSDDAAVALVQTCEAALRQAGVGLNAVECVAMARLVARRHGGFRRLQRLTGGGILTDDAATSPVRVEVAAAPAEREDEHTPARVVHTRVGSRGSR